MIFLFDIYILIVVRIVYIDSFFFLYKKEYFKFIGFKYFIFLGNLSLIISFCVIVVNGNSINSMIKFFLYIIIVF